MSNEENTQFTPEQMAAQITQLQAEIQRLQADQAEKVQAAIDSTTQRMNEEFEDMSSDKFKLMSSKQQYDGHKKALTEILQAATDLGIKSSEINRLVADFEDVTRLEEAEFLQSGAYFVPSGYGKSGDRVGVRLGSVSDVIKHLANTRVYARNDIEKNEASNKWAHGDENVKKHISREKGKGLVEKYVDHSRSNELRKHLGL